MGEKEEILEEIQMKRWKQLWKEWLEQFGPGEECLMGEDWNISLEIKVQISLLRLWDARQKINVLFGRNWQAIVDFWLE